MAGASVSVDVVVTLEDPHNRNRISIVTTNIRTKIQLMTSRDSMTATVTSHGPFIDPPTVSTVWSRAASAIGAAGRGLPASFVLGTAAPAPKDIAINRASDVICFLLVCHTTVFFARELVVPVHLVSQGKVTQVIN